MLVVDESSLASSGQMRNLMRIATALRLPRVVLAGDEKQLGAVEAGKPFAQLKAAGMATAAMDDIVRQRDAELNWSPTTPTSSPTGSNGRPASGSPRSMRPRNRPPGRPCSGAAPAMTAKAIA